MKAYKYFHTSTSLTQAPQSLEKYSSLLQGLLDMCETSEIKIWLLQ
jgi:hypothetical protein